MSKLVWSLCLFTSSLFASASNLYVAQNATGTGNGGSCSNAFAVAFFNNPANWGTTSLQIGPGTTVHLCGTITTELTAFGSGAAGSPLTILFESGAKLSLPFCSNRDVNGCINLSGKGFIVLDGGTNGVIENTASGSSSPHDPVGVLAKGTHDSEIRNLTISNTYVHSSSSDTFDVSRSAAIYMAGSPNNLAIHGNVMHDCHWCINYQFSSSASGVSIYGNEIYHAEHGIAFGGYGGGTVTGTKVYGNYIHDYANWDVTSGGYHHDGLHFYTNAGSLIDGADIYNNTFGGDPGVSLTSHVYIEHDGYPVNNVRVYNNVILPGPSNRDTNFGLMAFGANSGTQVYNNTIMCGAQTAGYGVNLEGGNTVLENNLITGCYADVAYYVTSPSVIVNFNAYANSVNVGYFLYNGSNFPTLANWQSASGQDGSSRYAASPGLDADGTLASGSFAIAAATNLSSLGWPNLNVDKAGVARPASGAWDAGAYQFSGVAAPPPTTYTLTVVNGTGGGNYTASTIVTITASAAPAGQVFLNWTGATVANPASPTTTLVMPAANATVTANYTSSPPPPTVQPTCSVSFVGRTTVIGPDGVQMVVAPSRSNVSGKITWTATGSVCP